MGSAKTLKKTIAARRNSKLGGRRKSLVNPIGQIISVVDPVDTKRIPKGYVYVGAGSGWENPYPDKERFESMLPMMVAAVNRGVDVEKQEIFGADLTTWWIAKKLRHLKGVPLACTCKPEDRKHHCAVLTRIANSGSVKA